jgi:protein-L-isoaspartate O-methyltransferase
MIELLRREGIVNERVLAAMTEIPRHAFVERASLRAPTRTRRCRSATARPSPAPSSWR